MCTCIEQMNEQLKARNFEVEATLPWGNKPVKILCRTTWIEKPKRAMGKPPLLDILYCPMCGEEYAGRKKED